MGWYEKLPAVKPEPVKPGAVHGSTDECRSPENDAARRRGFRSAKAEIDHLYRMNWHKNRIVERTGLSFKRVNQLVDEIDRSIIVDVRENGGAHVIARHTAVLEGMASRLIEEYDRLPAYRRDSKLLKTAQGCLADVRKIHALDAPKQQINYNINAEARIVDPDRQNQFMKDPEYQRLIMLQEERERELAEQGFCNEPGEVRQIGQQRQVELRPSFEVVEREDACGSVWDNPATGLLSSSEAR